MPTRIFGFTALYFMWCVITKVNVTEGRKLYISRSGDDKWSCDQSKPCKSIWRAVTLASRGDRIHLDGTNTSKDPYTCQTRTSQHPGIYINKSLSLIGSASPMPQIRCIEGTGLTFNGSDNAEQMNLTLSGLLVSESFVSFQDSSVNINGCKFKGKKQSVRIVIRTSIILSIRITDSTFSRSSECISVVVNSTKSPFSSIHVMFKLTNSYFYSNVLLDEGRCISFTEFPSSNQSIRCNITLENVTFSRNKFTSKGLVLLGINNGSHHVYFQNVTFVDNSPVLGKGSLTVNGDSECIFRGTVINILINSSSFTSEYARSISASASTISLQICNSSFLGHLAQGNGGVVSLRGTDLCNLGVSKSSFINTTAAQGGAINLECATVNSVSFEDSIFSGNTATNGGGGAVYISALKASVQLNHSAFTACTASHGGGVSIETGTNLPKIYPNNTDLLLTVESSNFTECSAHTGGGALNVYYKSDVQINFNRSRFIFNVVEFGFGGAIMAFPLEKATSLSRNSSTSQFTIESSTFANNLARQGGTLWLSLNSQSSLILRHVVMESNEATERFGGVAVIYDCRVKIQSSRFLNNLAGYDGGVFWIVGNVYSLEVVDSLFESNSVLSHSGGAFVIQMASVFQSILITNSTFNNCSSAYNGGAINIISGSVSLLIKRSRFTKNHCTFGSGGALHVSRPGDQLKAPGCIKNNTGNLINDVKEYNTQLIIENTVFERNSGLFGGAIYLDNGQATFNNCSFIDNFAGLKGGHIYSTFGFASLAIQHSIFRQNIKILKWNNMNYSNILFIQAENILTLKLHNSTFDVRPYGSTGPLMQVTDSRLIDLGNKHLTTTFNCPVGSQMEILNITVELTTLEFSCSACAGNSYSLQRGRALGSQVAPGFQCLPCPFGANCSQNILAKPNFWGFKERLNPPTLKFTMCPLGYCSPPLKTDFPEYNGCQGNRSGELCGQCNESYTETVYSSNCRPSHNCNDFWFWPVAFVYVSFMAFYFTFKPPIVPWIKRQILWFKERETANANEDDNFDRGYVKIVFYFYQAANLLVSSSSRHILKTNFIDIFVGLFNFQEKVSSSGLICPFPGLTVVTKQLFSASHLFGTCLMIGVFYVLHWGVQKCVGRGAPSVGPYIGGILQTVLLGYTTLASVSFNLLRCVPIGSQKRLFYDGNVVCFQWWQYILIAFICTFFVPFVFVLLWGSFKLFFRSLSVGKFLLACCFPLPFLLYWGFLALFGNPPNEGSPPSQNTSLKYIEMVLYDSFKRPEDGATLTLSWESVMIARRLILIVLKAFISDPMPRLLIMSFFCVLFLQHHFMTQPFVHSIANTVETISLLSVALLGMVNMFFASFVSLGVPLNDHFSSWWNVFQVTEIVILCAVPAVFGLLVVAACLSQVCRLTVVVCRLLYDVLFICFGWCYRKEDEEMRPLSRSFCKNGHSVFVKKCST